MYFSKNLWCDWRQGEAYFASQLIDWDFASNNGGWQWSASTGTDAAPYFRVFNPVSQSERFDPQGHFIRKYCPELATLDNKKIHDPYSRGVDHLDYPKPLVDLKLTRAFAIEAFKTI
jgi:deoxyribodipyrimidine photo-lyase